jgi:spermidine synthase
MPAGVYDLVVVNVGDPASASASRFYSDAFFRQVKSVLRPEGAVAVCGITGGSSYAGAGPILDYDACVYRTVASVFQQVVVRPGEEVCFFAASRPGVVSSDAGILTVRFQALGLRPEQLKYGFEVEEFPPERVEKATAALERASAAAPLNTDSRPVVFTLCLNVQSHYAAGAARTGLAERRGLWALARPVAAVWPCVLLGLGLCGVLLVRLACGPRAATPWACGLAVFTTGIAAMAAQMVIVYSYQTSFGYVYRDIAVLAGLFMTGLATGAWLAGQVAPAKPVRLLLALEAAQVVLVLLLPLLAGMLSFSPAAFMALSAAVGFVTGAEFPLAARASLGSGLRVPAAAASLNAVDQLGAVVGAAWSGLFLVPALGVAWAAALLTVAKCGSLVGLLAAASAPGAGPDRAAAPP